MEYWVGVVVGIIGTLIVVFMGISDQYWEPKAKCEQALPRNVECVWAPPTNNGEGGE